MNLENTLRKKTKIIATMGPTFEDKETIRDLFQRGVNVVRLNTSHGDFEEHGQRIKNAMEVRKEMDLPVSILLDTKGPEIRVHQIEGGKIEVEADKEFIIKYKEEVVGKDNVFSVTYDELGDVVEEGQLIMIDDGKLTLKVTSVDKEAGEIKVVSENKHYIGTKKAVNVPGADLTLPFIAKHDREFII